MQTPTVLSRTDRWVVISKPAGWLTIPGRDSPQGEPSGHPVALEWAQDWAQDQLGDERLWVVHRLDLETSGVLLLARTAAAHQLANRWFEAHRTKKTYDAIAQGRPLAPVLRLGSPIEGKPSLSQVEVVERASASGPGVPGVQDAFLARVRIVTGRRHQIRIHLSEAGHPIWGDERYGGSREPWPGVHAGRVALHAARLELPEGEVFEAPWPEDFRGWVETLRSDRVNQWRGTGK